MPKQNAFKPYNVKALVHNVESVFKTGRIEQLNQPTYQFITLHMGFIAHYDLLGFREEYRDLRVFCQKLQTSEYSLDYNYNMIQAVRQETDSDFRKWYGEAYNHSIAQAIRGIVTIARKYADKVRQEHDRLERMEDIEEARNV